MTYPQETLWISPREAGEELCARGYKPECWSGIASSHEEVALSLIALSDTAHDIIGLSSLIRAVEALDDRGEV